MIAMVNSKIVVIILTTVALAVATTVTIDGNTHVETPTEKGPPSEYTYINGLDITVLCPSNEETVTSFFDSHSIPYSTSNDRTSDSEMIILTKRWVEQNQDTHIDDYVHMAEQGSILIAVDATIDYEKTGLTMSYNNQAEVNVIWMKTNQIRCNSPYLQDTYESLVFVFDWIEKRLYEDHVYSDYEGQLGTEIESIGTYSSNGYGNSAIQTYYYILPDASQDYDYTAAHYHVQMIPDGGSFNSVWT